MAKEKVILENLEKAREFLQSIGVDPERAWNNSTPYYGVRQLHVAVKKDNIGESIPKEELQFHKLRYSWSGETHWLNVYFYARKYVRKDTKLEDYQLASDGYWLQQDLD